MKPAERVRPAWDERAIAIIHLGRTAHAGEDELVARVREHDDPLAVGCVYATVGHFAHPEAANGMLRQTNTGRLNTIAAVGRG